MVKSEPELKDIPQSKLGDYEKMFKALGVPIPDELKVKKVKKLKNKIKTRSRSIKPKSKDNRGLQVCKTRMIEKCTCSGRGRPPSGSCGKK